MTNRFLTPLFTFSLFILTSQSVFAGSSYVLPYPSSMPGSKFYTIRLIWDEIKSYWYFGDFGQFKYKLKQADKYLVEAKTLFEYKQYFLASKALRKSDDYFKNISLNLLKAKKKNKNITQKQNLLKKAALKHIEVLIKIESEIPNTFIWRPEKSLPTVLNLDESVGESIAIRKKYL